MIYFPSSLNEPEFLFATFNNKYIDINVRIIHDVRIIQPYNQPEFANPLGRKKILFPIKPFRRVKYTDHGLSFCTWSFQSFNFNLLFLVLRCKSNFIDFLSCPCIIFFQGYHHDIHYFLDFHPINANMCIPSDSFFWLDWIHIHQ